MSDSGDPGRHDHDAHHDRPVTRLTASCQLSAACCTDHRAPAGRSSSKSTCARPKQQPAVLRHGPEVIGGVSSFPNSPQPAPAQPRPGDVKAGEALAIGRAGERLLEAIVDADELHGAGLAVQAAANRPDRPDDQQDHVGDQQAKPGDRDPGGPQQHPRDHQAEREQTGVRVASTRPRYSAASPVLAQTSGNRRVRTG
jgi:hypothetical protein